LGRRCPVRHYTIRPYFGFDCDSVNGFNNGHYLDEIVVEASSEEEAITLAMDKYIEINKLDMSRIEQDGWFGEGTLYSEERDAEDSEEYTYQYVCFNSVKEEEL
jgi:hypothetical protein